MANLVEGSYKNYNIPSLYVLVSQNKEIKKVFQYHGAEHKTIHAYENAEELTVENVESIPPSIPDAEQLLCFW